MSGTRDRAATWAAALLRDPIRVTDLPDSIVAFDGTVADLAYRTLAIVPDSNARFARARSGEFGLDEGLALARAITNAPSAAALVPVVDVPGQAFGRSEEAAGLQLSLAAAVDAYITQRRQGRPVLTLVVGKAISGAFLAHGLQAGWIGALDDPRVEVHVMSAGSVARVTRSSEQEVARIASVVPATARDVASFASFGAIDERFAVGDADRPTATELATIRESLDRARRDGRGTRAPVERLAASGASASRSLARAVRDRIDREW